MEVTRLTSSTPSDSEDSEYDDPAYCKPRIVDVLKKPVNEKNVSNVSLYEEINPNEIHQEEKDRSIVVEQQQSTVTTVENVPSKSNEIYQEEEDTPVIVEQQRRSITTIENVSSESENASSMPIYREIVKPNKNQQVKERPVTLNENEVTKPVAPEQQRRPVTYDEIKMGNLKEGNNTDDQMESVGTLKGFTAGRRKAKANINMASPRPKSPRPPVAAARKDEKEESFWEKIGTLGRKKRIKEVQEVQEEGKYAIDSPGSPTAPDLPPEEYTLEENEERSMIEPRSFEDPKLKELIEVLIEWINDELADQRIIVKDIEEDLYDGQVLQKLLEKLTGEKLDVPEVTQSEEGQKQKLGIVLAATNRVLSLPRYSQQKWSVESVHSKNIVAILHLLVALARHFRAPVRLPENVAVGVVVVQKRDGSLSHRTVLEEITSTYDDLGMRCERDAFDTLFDHAPDKLQVVKKSLVTFVNKHLNKVNLEVSDLDTQFHDGVYLTLLMGLLEGFFVPLYSFHLTPQDFDQKVHNVNFAFDLMQDVGLAKPKARPEDIVNLDLKSTLRVLYNLFTKYKNMS